MGAIIRSCLGLLILIGSNLETKLVKFNVELVYDGRSFGSRRQHNKQDPDDNRPHSVPFTASSLARHCFLGFPVALGFPSVILLIHCAVSPWKYQIIVLLFEKRT